MFGRFFKKSCKSCKGSGKQICGSCGGSGELSNSAFHDKYGDDYGNFYIDQRYAMCDKCFGTGRMICMACGGKGENNGK